MQAAEAEERQNPRMFFENPGRFITYPLLVIIKMVLRPANTGTVGRAVGRRMEG